MNIKKISLCVITGLMAFGATANNDFYKLDFESPQRGAITGSITAGTVTFTYTNFTQTSGSLTDFTLDGVDNLFSNWWYFRVSGDSAETKFPAPDTGSYVGDTATLNWNDVEARGLFSASLRHQVAQPAAQTGTLSTRLVITNISGASLDIDLFAYMDFDAGASAGNDEASLVVDPEHINIIDNGAAAPTNTSNYKAGGAAEFQVGAWPAIRNLLTDAAVDDFDGSGLPFGPADFTAGHQWTTVTIPVDGTYTIELNAASGNMTADDPSMPVIFDPADVIFANGFEQLLP